MVWKCLYHYLGLWAVRHYPSVSTIATSKYVFHQIWDDMLMNWSLWQDHPSECPNIELVLLVCMDEVVFIQFEPPCGLRNLNQMTLLYRWSSFLGDSEVLDYHKWSDNVKVNLRKGEPVIDTYVRLLPCVIQRMWNSVQFDLEWWLFQHTAQQHTLTVHTSTVEPV